MVILNLTFFLPGGSSDKVDTTYDGKNGVRCLWQMEEV